MNQHSGTSNTRGVVRLGPQARRAYVQLHHRIMAGLLTPGTRLLRQTELARALGVSLLTLRRALAQLEQDGLIATHQGRGTFVQAPVPLSVLILEDDPVQQEVLAAHVQAQGCRVVRASSLADGVVAVQQHPAIALILCDLRLPAMEDGIWFIQTAQQLWPDVPLAVVTAHPEDLRPLQGRPAHPVLIVTKPVTATHVTTILGYALGRLHRPSGPALQHRAAKPRA